MTAAIAALAFTLPATPAAAQGSLSPFPSSGAGCPTGWTPGGNTTNRDRPDPKMCYARSSSAPLAYANPSRKACAEGYTNSSGYCYVKKAEYNGPSAADQLVSNASLVKASKGDRCPLGYFSKADMATCTTWLSPATSSRRKAGACRAGELDEWGLYCTSNTGNITREQAEQEATRDFNAIYTATGANYPNQGSDTENYPSMIAAYGPKGGRRAAASSSSSNSQSASNDAPAANTNCPTPSSTGATLGGALGGDAGAALGSMLGGLGKKKKKAGC